MSQEKDNSTQGQALQPLSNMAPQQFIALKLQKISSVIHLLTAHFPVDEPLRRDLRRKALDAHSLSFKLLSAEGGSKGQIASEIMVILTELRSLFELSLSAGLLSAANVEILRTEIDAFSDYLKSQDVSRAFHVESRDFTPLDSDVKNMVLLAEKTVHDDAVPSGGVRESHSVSPIQKTAKQSVPAGDLSRAKKRRREAILGVLKSKGEVGIREIAAEVSGCSRKTIQRELSDLVDEGVLARHGDRRWSTYRLIATSSV